MGLAPLLDPGDVVLDLHSCTSRVDNQWVINLDSGVSEPYLVSKKRSSSSSISH